MKNILYATLLVSLCVFVAKFYSCEDEVNLNKLMRDTKRTEKVDVKVLDHIVDKKHMTDFMKKVQPKMFPELADIIYTSIIRYSKEYNISPVLLFSIIYQESQFHPWAISSKKCLGLTQVNYSVWGEILKDLDIIEKRSDLFNPRNNIRAGAYIFKHYLKRGFEKNLEYPHNYALKKYYGNLESTYDKKVFHKKEKYMKFLAGRVKL